MTTIKIDYAHAKIYGWIVADQIDLCQNDGHIRITETQEGWVVWRIHEETSPRDGSTYRMITRLIVIPYTHTQESPDEAT